MIEKLKQEGEGWVDEEGCFWNSKAEYIQIAILGFCGCGDPDAVMEYVRKMLLKLKRKERAEDRPYMFFVYWANDKGFAEHNSNSCFSWLTTKGQELLRDIEEVGRGQNAAGQGRREATYPEPAGSALDSDEPDDREERCDLCGEVSHCLMRGLCPPCYELNGGTHAN